MDNQKLKICVATSSRSERQLIQPLLRRLEKHPKFSLYVLELPPSDFHGAYEIASDFLRLTSDVALAVTPFDRVEQLGACLAFKFKGVKVCQLHTGDISGGGEVFDDWVRWMITLCADVLFCNGSASYLRTLKFLEAVGKSTKHIYEVGSFAFDDLELDKSIVPKEPFDLILYNPLSARPDLIPSELNAIERMLQPKITYWLEPNEDVGRDLIVERIQRLEREGKVKGLKTLPRPQYLALLKYAERCIGNSSSFLLELPFLSNNYIHIHVGLRNKDRERVEPRTGGSDRIIKILEEVLA